MPPPQTSDNQTIWQRIEWLRGMMQYPALTVMVLTRWDIGYRLLNPIALLVMFAVLYLLSGNSRPAERPQDLLAFACAMLAAGIFQRIVRWIEIVKGTRQHTYYIGTSVLERLARTRLLKRNRRVSRYVEPIVVFGIGLFVLRFSFALGGWLMFAGFCIRVLEDTVYKKELHQKLDMADGLVEADVQGNHVEQFEKPQRSAQNDSDSIPTGVGDDVQQHMKRRRPN